MTKSLINPKHFKALLLTSCALSAMDGNAGFAADINHAEGLVINVAPIGIRRVTVQTDRGILDVNIGTEVNIENQHLGDTGLRNLLQYLPNNLVSLRIRGAGITHEGVTTLLRGRSSQHIRNLVALDLGANNIGVEGAEVIARKLTTRLANVTSLNLENASVGAEGACQLTGGFGDRLRRAFFDNTGGYLHGSRVISLNLRSNNIGDNGVHELVRRVRLPQNLAELNLSNNGLTSAAVLSLFDRNSNEQRLPRTLRNLLLNDNQIGDAVVDILRDNSRVPIELQQIDLRGNPISEDALVQLHHMIPSVAILSTPPAAHIEPAPRSAPVVVPPAAHIEPAPRSAPEVVLPAAHIDPAPRSAPEVVLPAARIDPAPRSAPVVVPPAAHIEPASRSAPEVVLPAARIEPAPRSAPVVVPPAARIEPVPRSAQFGELRQVSRDERKAKSCHTNNLAFLEENRRALKKAMQFLTIEEGTTATEAASIVRWVAEQEDNEGNPIFKKSLQYITMPDSLRREPGVRGALQSLTSVRFPEFYRRNN